MSKWELGGAVFCILIIGMLICTLSLGKKSLSTDERMAYVEAQVVDLRFEIKQLKRQIAKLEVKNLPTVNIHRASVFNGDGRVVIQGLDTEDAE